MEESVYFFSFCDFSSFYNNILWYSVCWWIKGKYERNIGKVNIGYQNIYKLWI